MTTLKFPMFLVWIYCFNYCSVQSQSTQNVSIHKNTLVVKTKRQTSTLPNTDYLPFGTRISSSHQILRNNSLQESKESPSHQKDQNTDIRDKSISKHNRLITDPLENYNSSGDASSNSRRFKKIKAMKRRLRPTNRDSNFSQILDANRRHSFKSEQDLLMLHPKLHGDSMYETINSHQERLGNKTAPNDRKSMSVSHGMSSGNRDYFRDLQRNTTGSYVRASSIAAGDTGPRYRDNSHEISSVSRIESYKRNTSIVSDYEMTPDINHQKRGERNRTFPDGIINLGLSYDRATRNNNNLLNRKANAYGSHGRDRSTVSSDKMTENIDHLQQKLKSSSESDDRNSTIVPDNIMVKTIDHLHKRPGNMFELGERSSVTDHSNAMIRGRDNLDGRQRNFTGIDERYSVSNNLMAKNKISLNERKENKTDILKRNNVVSGDNLTRNETLLNVRIKENSTNAFSHPVKSEVFDKYLVEVNDGDGALPCPCYWNKKNCGCNCTGSLDYDDFQILAKSFRPCQNFSFSLSGGTYFSLPPNLFTRVSRVENFSFKVSNSTFDYLLDPTPGTSPFKGVIFGRKCLLEVHNVSVRRGWNWASLKNLKSSGTEGLVDVEITGCGLKRLSSDFASVAGGHVGNLRVAESELEMVGSGAFSTFDGLMRFQLPKNRLTSIKRSDLPAEPQDLEEIDLRGNLLQALDKDLFTQMPSLQVISLAGNPLRMLGEQTFGLVIGKAHLLGLADFPLTCDCRLQWLKNSTLSHNSMFSENLQGITCRRPPHLHGTLFNTLSKEHLTC